MSITVCDSAILMTTSLPCTLHSPDFEHRDQDALVAVGKGLQDGALQFVGMLARGRDGCVCGGTSLLQAAVVPVEG